LVDQEAIVQSVMDELRPAIPRGEDRLTTWLELSVRYHVGHAVDGRRKWAVTLSGKDSMTETFVAWMSMRHLRQFGLDSIVFHAP
jgi:hypothetical protein